MKEQRSERGQVLVLIILAIVALLGFAALAVDGGMLYAERRRAQSAADAAAYAAGLKAISGANFTQIKTEVLNHAKLNGYENDGVNNTVQIFNPPTTGMYAGHKNYYQVLITQQLKMGFSQFVYNGDQELTVEAVAHADPTGGVSSGNAIHAVLESGKGVDFMGSFDVTVNGGNIYSADDGEKCNCKGSITVNDGNVIVSGEWTQSTINMSPKPTQGAPLQPMPYIPEPDCSKFPERSVPHKGNTLEPGNYDEIKINGGNWTLMPGMYCVTGSKGFTVNGNATITGNGVTIVVLKGTTKLNGNGEVHLTRPSSIQDSAGNQFGGLLLYHPKSNTNEVYLSGTNDTDYSGTIYAPGSQCDVGGNNVTVGVNANMICYNFKIHGNPSITINYKEAQNYRMPPTVELAQ